ncbi:MAG: multidrug effflux MFS transporter [Caldilineaceae bacterium]
MRTTETHQPSLSFGEFVALMALLIALVALSIDTMLPALGEIGGDLGMLRQNDRQLIISLLFLGMAVGQLFYGPLSDSIGRKPAIYAGLALFMVGSLICLLAQTFSVMLAGRLVQGIGVAGPRSVTLALVRDQYAGRGMARIMSFVMAVFILVPVIAPTLGQGILLFAHWRAIFGLFLLLAVVMLAWFGLRQPETLPPARRIPFALGRITAAIGEICTNRAALGFTLMSGLISGAFLGFLSSAQQIFQEQYGLGAQFPLYFALLALASGVASYVNGRLVMRYGMRLLSRAALMGLIVLSLLFLGVAGAQAGSPPLALTVAYFMLTFFAIGLLFGNLNALAMEPLGHIAGIGAALVGSLSTLISVPLGTLIGQSYNGTILPLVGGYVVLSILSALVMWWAERAPVGEAEQVAEELV